MRDTLNRLARGEFLADFPTLSIDEERIEKSLSMGDLGEWELKITSSKGSFKGVVYSDNARVVPEEEGLLGNECVMHYKVDARGLCADDVLDGHFNLVTNAGNRQIPYKFRITNKTIQSSIGPIHNLFHFANLVQVSEDEACKIFVRDDFEQIFIKNDSEVAAVYRSLKCNPDTRLAMEEFLIAVHKKQPITIMIKEDAKNDIKRYENVTEDYHDSISLKKNTWGHIKAAAYSDAEFVVLEKNTFTTDDFLGNTFELGFVIKKDYLHAGNNFARITVHANGETVVKEIEIIQKHENGRERTKTHTLKLNTDADITRLYIEYRIQKKTFEEWAEATINVLEVAVASLDDVSGYRLMQAQVYCMMGKREDAKWLMEQVRDEAMQDENSLLYAFFLYISTLYEKNQEYTRKVADILHRKYEYGERRWQLLWMLFYVDNAYDRNKSLKLARIKELFHGGCHSPIMYLEACDIIDEQPMFLRVFDEFERQIINFGCKYDIIHSRLASQICEMGAYEKSVSKTYLRILKVLYDRFGTDEILTVLCEHMIRNQMTGPDCFDTYELGVLRGLHITKLYESYMDSLVPPYEGLLPKMLLMYFSYDNQLQDYQKAFLYVNVLQNLGADDPIRRSFAQQMEQFAIAQLRMGNISDNLVYIYKEMWNESLIRKETAVPVARLLFAYKLTCHEPGMRSVVVTHKELASEVVVPIIGNVAYVSIYTEGCCIAFEDMDGNRRVNIHYELERLLEMPECVENAYELIPDDIYLAIHYYERNRKYKMCDVRVPEFWEHLLNRMEISKVFANELLDVLIEYYHSSYIGTSFKEELPNLVKRNLLAKQSAKLIESCIIYGLNKEALDLTITYGTKYVGVKRLFKLCHYFIENEQDDGNAFLVKMCHEVFIGGQYDDVILNCLEKHYNGTTDEMIKIWERCKGFDVQCYELEERLVAQMIFTRDRQDKLSELFESYYEQGAKERIVEAYLSNEAYVGFIRQEKNDENIYRVIESRIEYEDDVTDLCKLALLYYYSQKEELDEKTAKRARILLTYFANKDMLFKFFEKFAQKAILPLKAMDKTVIEYRATPGSRVTLHYALGENEDAFVDEPMKDVFMGIFTKTFTLFHGEMIQYYITVENDGEEIKTEMSAITCNDDADKVGGRYGCLNDMLICKDNHDNASLSRLMRSYCVEDYITRQLFKIR